MSSPSHSPTPVAEKLHSFTILLSVYGPKKKEKGKTVPKVTMETKELTFAVNDTNYLNFLQHVLDKHGQGQYRVSSSKHFPFKFVPPKVQAVSNAIDVDNKVDYKDMDPPISPPIPSPSHLSCFLCYAEMNLSVCNATLYEWELELQLIRLDILMDIDDQTLARAGI
ncbi:hypothetical protein BKA82DRAFT_115540, partial [Pisolithus tinctorius]